LSFEDNWREKHSKLLLIVEHKDVYNHQLFISLMANIWTDDETKLLITIWRDQNIQQQLENHSIRNKIVYEKLAKGMADGGFNRNAKQCQSKIKHLREKYRTYKDKIARSGAGASKPPKFFNEIDEMLGTRPQTRPTFLLDSGNADAEKESSSSSEYSRKYNGSFHLI
jgi:hypothetical protein